MNYKKRLQKLRNQMQEVGIDALLVTNIKNIFYLSGFTGSTALMLISDSEAYFFTDSRYVEQAQEQCKFAQIIEIKKQDNESVKEILQKIKPVKTGFENSISYSQYKKFCSTFSFEIFPAGQLVEKIRRIKEPEEIINMKKAMNIAESALKNIMPMIKPGVKEIDISTELEFTMRKMGATDRSFDFIVASGPRSSMPHGVATDRIIKNNEFVTIDFGCVYQGYCSDMTRTVCVGKPDEEMKRVYNTVLKAQLTAIDSIKDLTFCEDVDKVARTIIENEGYGKYFGHGLGHSIGLEVHESPSFSQTCPEAFEDGMIFSVEPGIYIPKKFGVRIEDLILIENKKSVNFNEFEKDLIEL